MKKRVLFIFYTIGSLFLFNDWNYSQVSNFIDDFESHTAGQQLVCQDSLNWTTFFGNPCHPVEDPLILTNYSITGTKSVRIIQNNDLVKPFGSHTVGYWIISFWIYIPSGKAGYFNTLAVFDGVNSVWAMECYFDVGGLGRILVGFSNTATFSWIANDWQFVQLIVNLDLDQAKFYFDYNLIDTWQWSDGIPGGNPPSLEATNFFGYPANHEMYIDNYVFFGPPLTPPPFYGPTNLVAEVVINPSPKVNLTWQDNSLYEYAFNIIRKDGPLSDPGNFEPIGTAPQNTTLFIDSTVIVDSTYTYAVFAYNEYGFSDTSNFATIILNPVNVISENQELNTFMLEQNYPNPFNPTTKIKFTIPHTDNPLQGGARGGLVTLKVYDVLGNEIATLVNEEKPAGEYEVEFDATGLTSGIYFYKLQAGDPSTSSGQGFNQTRKMILLK